MNKYAEPPKSEKTRSIRSVFLSLIYEITRPTMAYLVCFSSFFSRFVLSVSVLTRVWACPCTKMCLELSFWWGAVAAAAAATASCLLRASFFLGFSTQDPGDTKDTDEPVLGLGIANLILRVHFSRGDGVSPEEGNPFLKTEKKRKVILKLIPIDLETWVVQFFDLQ